jgi:hypothetical protein
MMKRCAFKVVLFLLAGAIINVAVAWGCAVHLSRHWPTNMRLNNAVQTHETHLLMSRFGLRPAFDDSGYRFSNRSSSFRNRFVSLFCFDQYAMAVASGPNGQQIDVKEAWHIESGWPLVALAGARWRERGLWPNSPIGEWRYSGAFRSQKRHHLD